MTDLSALSADELKAELARREEASKPRLPEPKALADVDWSEVHRTVVDGVNDSVQRDYQDDDLEGYVWEAVIEAVYGKEYWPWRRAQKW